MAFGQNVLISFDDLADQTIVPNGYQGLDWSNFRVTNGSQYVTSGYQNGVVSGENLVFNRFADPASLTSDRSFLLKSAYLTAAWNNGLSVTVTGYRNGDPVHSQTYTVDANAPTKLTFNWRNLTGVGFSSTGGENAGLDSSGTHFVMDDLLISYGPDSVDTRASIQPNASGMRNIFSLLTSYANPGLSYDCSVFDKNGICVAVSGRTTMVSSSDVTSYSGILTAAYKIDPKIRIGGFVEQLASDIDTGGVKLQNNAPDFGVFGVWQEREDAEGFKFRAAYRYGKKDMTITRAQIGTAEAGTGNSQLTAEGLQLTLSNGFRVAPTVVLSPYAGIRYVNIGRNAYTENASDSVTAPLTYDKLSQELSSALLGANIDAWLAPQLTLNVSAGIEHDFNQNIGKYQGSGVDGLTPLQFGDDGNRTRAVAAAGLTYAIDKTQAVSARVFYREEAYASISTTTGLLTYSAGF